MIIYEVNLTIEKAIYQDYYPWLLEHIDVVLKIPGFQQAQIYQIKSDDVNAEQLTVHYTLASEQDLDNYLTHHAAALRADAVNRFGSRFSAVRRILNPV